MNIIKGFACKNKYSCGCMFAEAKGVFHVDGTS